MCNTVIKSLLFPSVRSTCYYFTGRAELAIWQTGHFSGRPTCLLGGHNCLFLLSNGPIKQVDQPIYFYFLFLFCFLTLAWSITYLNPFPFGLSDFIQQDIWEKSAKIHKTKHKGGAEKLWALKADAHKCVKRTAMFAAGPSSAPVVDDGGGGHNEEDGERERDEGESGGRVKLAVFYHTKIIII